MMLLTRSLAGTWKFLQSGVDDMVCCTIAYVVDEAIHGGYVV